MLTVRFPFVCVFFCVTTPFVFADQRGKISCLINYAMEIYEMCFALKPFSGLESMTVLDETVWFGE